MTEQSPIKQSQKVAALSGLALLRAPFPPNQISKLPKPTKKQTEEVRADFKKGIRCQVCGAWHHPQVVHLDYVGHAALTDRLLDCDPEWNWEPVALTDQGTPAIDSNGGMWIRLTVCGVTRLGYGHPDGKQGGDAIKELIGDALRNAAMRFGAALDFWHKGDLHGAPDLGDSAPGDDSDPPPFDARQAADRIITALKRAQSLDALAAAWRGAQADLAAIRADLPEAYAECEAEKDARKAALTPAPNADLGEDEIPY